MSIQHVHCSLNIDKQYTLILIGNRNFKPVLVFLCQFIDLSIVSM